MPSISTNAARNIFTQTVVDVYKEMVKPTSFLRSFFPSVESTAKEISIEVMRGTEKVAVDVTRGTLGNRNQWTKSTQKVFLPPYYREFFDITELQAYDRLFGSTAIDSSVFENLAQDVAEKLADMQSKIERAYEKQCSEALTSGIVTVANGDNIDFKRKAGSLVDLGSGNYFTDNIDPFTVFETGGNFLRQVGKSQGGVLNAICGSSALATLLANTKFVTRQNLIAMMLDSVAAPQRNSVGATLHGQITAGSYRVNLWSYPEFYDNAGGTSTPYVDPKKVILLPEQPRFKTAFAAVPQLPTAGSGVKKGAYLIGDYVEEREGTHIFDIKSAGIAIPVAVDQIYTFKALA